jgi:precorrin-3B methylase
MLFLVDLKIINPGNSMFCPDVVSSCLASQVGSELFADFCRFILKDRKACWEKVLSDVTAHNSVLDISIAMNRLFL